MPRRRATFRAMPVKASSGPPMPRRRGTFRAMPAKASSGPAMQ